MSVPLWLPMGSVVVLLLLRALERRQRRHNEQCIGCAYDLSGLSETAGRVVCPECGTSGDAPAPRATGNGAKPRDQLARSRLPTLRNSVIAMLILAGLLLTTWIVVSIRRDAASRRVQAFILGTDATLDGLMTEIMNFEAWGRGYPKDLVALNVGYAAKPPLDAWGRPITYFPWTNESQYLVFTSAGPDGVFGTKDDLLRLSDRQPQILDGDIRQWMAEWNWGSP